MSKHRTNHYDLEDLREMFKFALQDMRERIEAGEEITSAWVAIEVGGRPYLYSEDGNMRPDHTTEDYVADFMSTAVRLGAQAGRELRDERRDAERLA